MKILVPICILLLSTSISSSWILNADENAVDDETVYRLPETVIPTSYDLWLTIDPADTTFAGSAKIIFDVNENVTINQISLHFDGDYITVDSIKLNNKIACTADAPNEASISIVKCTGAASGTGNFLNIEYKGQFSTDGYGLVKTSYLDQGKEETIIESVFEPIYARRAFPCFDEPDLRAQFSVVINHPSEYSAISNSPSIETPKSGENTTTTTKFDLTPKIPTYLLSFLISKLQVTEVQSEGGYDVKIFTRAEVANSTTKVLQNYYSPILDRLGNYTGVSYQDIKDTECYQVALPELSVQTGGFGLFEYRESDLLDDEDKTTARTIQDIVRNIAYQLVHEWYGGDLTVSWWSDIWSNEAVASYISYTIADDVTDNFDIKNQFVAEVFRKSLQADAYSFAQPLSSSEADVNRVDSITKKLDSLSLQKGASIVRMMGSIIGGEDALKEGLSKHLLNRNETETDGSDLIKDLTEDNSEEDIGSYLQTWVFSPGYPLLTTKIVNVTGTGVEVLRVFQKRFLYPTENAANDDTQWVIPFNTASGSNKEFYIRTEGYYFPDEEAYFFYGKNSYLMFNVQSGYFYRVNYDEVMWKRIISCLKDETQKEIIDPFSRAQLVDDVFNIARAGEIDYTIAFELADFLETETDYYIWYAAFDAFSYLIGKLGDVLAEDRLYNYILRLMDKVLKESNNKKRAGDDTETHIEVLRRVLVTKWACELVDLNTVGNILDQYNEIKADPSSLEDTNLRGVIYCNGIRYSENITEDTNYLWEIYAKSKSVHEKKDILNALGCAEYKDFLLPYLLKTITPDSEIRREDVLTVFKSIFASSGGISAAISFLDANITEVVSLGKNIWPEILYTLAEQLFTDEHLDWINEKLDNTLFDGYDDVKSKVKSLVAVNNYWTNHFQVYVKEIFLNDPTTKTSTTTTTTTTKPTTTTTSIPTTTDTTTTTTGSANSVLFSSIIAPVIVLIILFFN